MSVARKSAVVVSTVIVVGGASALGLPVLPFLCSSLLVGAWEWNRKDPPPNKPEGGTP